MKDEGFERREGRPHESLQVYRLAHDLALRVHAISLKLPKFELYEEASQVYLTVYRKLFNYMRSVEKQHDPEPPDQG